MNNPQHKTLKYKGVEMAYRISGQGYPLILMHGWGCSGKTVEFIERIAADSNCQVYNVDFPGFGESSEPHETWGVEEYTCLIEELERVENIVKPILIGHSFGGRVAILFGSRNETDKIILVDAAGVKPKRKLKYYIKVYSFKTLKSLWRLLLPKEKAERMIEEYRKKRGSADYSSSSPRMRQILSKVVNEDLRHVMPAIKSPTLLIWGKEDTATPIRDAKIMNRLIPDSGLVEFENAGHYSFLDQPARFRAVLSNFLTH